MDRQREDEENLKVLSLSNQIYPESKKRSMKTIVRCYTKDKQRNLSDYVQSVGAGRPSLRLDRITRGRDR